MKKLIALIIAVFVCFSTEIPCFAVTKGDIMSAINEGITVNGRPVHVPSNYVSMASNYLNSHNLTDAQLSRIMSAVQSAKARVKREMEEKENATSGSNSVPSAAPAETNGQSSNGRNSPGESSPQEGEGTAGGASGTGSQPRRTTVDIGSQPSNTMSDSIIESMGIGDKNLTPKQKLALSDAAIEVAEAAGATVTTDNKNVVIVDKDGNTYHTDQLNPIKATGVAYSFTTALVIGGMILGSMAACCYAAQSILKEKKKNEAE